MLFFEKADRILYTVSILYIRKRKDLLCGLQIIGKIMK